MNFLLVSFDLEHLEIKRYTYFDINIFVMTRFIFYKKNYDFKISKKNLER